MNRTVKLLFCIAIVAASVGLMGTAKAGEPNVPPIPFWTPKDAPKTQYKINFAIELAEQASLKGRETIHFVNTTGRPIQTLAIGWSEADAAQTMNITVHGKPITLASMKSFPKDFTLARPLKPGESLDVEVEFGASMPTPKDLPEEIDVSAWYPELWWGAASSCDFEVKLSVPKEYVVLTSGRFDPDGGCYRIENAPSFGFVLGKNREILKRDAGDVSIQCLYEAKNKQLAELLVDTAADAIGFYRERFGFYPYRSLSIVPGMDQPAGGYPMTTSIIVIHGMGRMAEKPEIHWRWITAHEIGHQYWGRHVLEKDDPGWLWIGLGIYMDREYCRARGLSAEKHKELVARYIEGARQGLDTTVSRSEEEMSQIKFDFNNVVIHGKGFAIVSTLDCVLGPETFGRIYGQCLKRFAGRRMGLADFQAVCEQESGQDLTWFFDQWVNSNRYLAYEIASQDCRKGDVCTTEVQVRCLGTLTMPVPVEARFEDGSSQRLFTNRLHDTDTLRFESRSPLKEVRLDPDESLPMIVPPPSPHAREISAAVNELPWSGAGEKALAVFKKVKESDYPDMGAWFKLGLALYDGKYYQEAMEAFARVESCDRSDPARVSAAITWQGHLFDLLGQRDKAVECYKRALAQPVPPNMRHDQYKIRLSREWIEKRLDEPFRR
ncbi:MAG: M1 family aminopeptidase [Phycisphaerales bacterium]